MALTTCKECKKEISTSAKACPHCGAKRPSPASTIWTAIKLVIALLFGLVVYQCTSLANRTPTADRPKDTMAAPPDKAPYQHRCAPQDFTVSALKFRREYDTLNFTGTVTNSGALACGVQLKVSTYDGAESVVETKDFWPASIRNIAPGAAENFAYFVRYDKSAKRYDVVPIDAKAWSR